MATDLLVAQAVKTKNPGDIAAFLVDGTTPAQKAAIDASGNLHAVLSAGTNLVGVVGIDQLTAGANDVVIKTALPGGTNIIGGITNTDFAINNFPVVQTVTILASSSLPTGTNSLGTVGLNAGVAQIGFVGIDQVGSANGVQIVSGPGFNTATPLFTSAASGAVGTSIGNPEFSELVAGSATIGAVGLNAGTNLIGSTSIDQTTQGQTNGISLAPLSPGTSLSNPIFVSTETGVAIVVRNSGQLTTGATALAVGSVAVMTAPAVTAAKTGTLKHAVVSASVPLKVELQNATGITVVTMFTSASNLTATWSEIVLGEILSASGGDFSVQVTNMDNSSAATAYAYLSWAEV